MSVSRTPGRMTPGRRRNANKENVYFEPGKQGRKTGITIPDTGVRDEHGFEPMSQLFSSPQRPSPPKEPAGRKTRSSTTDRNREHEQNIDGTSGIAAQTSLQAQKTPRLPPPKSQTPRHTNIGGSPVRHSSVKPTSPFRVMQDSNTTPTRAQSEVIRSIERDPSPVQARTAANARAGRPRKSIFDVNLSPEKITPQAPSSPPPGAIEEVSQILDTNDHEVADTQIPELDNSLPNLTDSSAVDPSPRQINTGEPNTKRKRERARRSDVSTTSAAAETSQVSSEPRSSAKRRRINMDTSQVEPSPSQATRSATRQANSASRASLERVEASQEQLEDDAPLPPVDDTQDVSHPTLRSSPAKRGRNKRKSVGLPSSRRRNASAAASRTSQPKKSRAQRESTARTSNYSAEATSGDEDEEGTTRMGSIRLRSATPAQDEGARITRSGRASIKPLAWWKNESYVYRNGSIDGVIRAEELPPEKRRGTVPRGRRGGRRKTGRLDTIEEEGEEEEHEDLLPEAWEEDLKVIRGPVRAWDRELGAGGVDEVEEDVAFAAKAIETHEVAGGSFRYAKVLTSDFFGAGVVEIPPGGVKRSKNSRKMQMAFFVHQGKVSVDVAGMGFGVTQGGMWHVPRGNNYQIENESSIFPAKIFFAQGCEYDAATQRAAAEAETVAAA